MRRALFLLLLLFLAALATPALAQIYWDPVSKDARNGDPTEKPVGWVVLTEAEAAPIFVRDGNNYLVRTGLAKRYLKSVADKPVEMDAAEKASVDLARNRTLARSRLSAAVLEILTLGEVKSRLTAAGKSTAVVDARITTLETTVTAALGDLP